MIVEYIRYRIEADRSDLFVKAYEDAQVSLQQSPYCLRYDLSRCTEAPEQFVLRIEWTSEQDHLQGFRKSPQFQPFLQAIQPFVKNIEEMRHYAATSVVWSRK
jgi:quinol monooxygenase YgiN